MYVEVGGKRGEERGAGGGGQLLLINPCNAVPQTWYLQTLVGTRQGANIARSACKTLTALVLLQLPHPATERSEHTSPGKHSYPALSSSPMMGTPTWWKRRGEGAGSDFLEVVEVTLSTAPCRKSASPSSSSAMLCTFTEGLRRRGTLPAGKPGLAEWNACGGFAVAGGSTPPAGSGPPCSNKGRMKRGSHAASEECRKQSRC